MSREEAENGLKKGGVYAAQHIPGFVQDHYGGTNTGNSGTGDQSQMESRIFKELTQGSRNLGAAQAGIYSSGDECLIKKGRQEENTGTGRWIKPFVPGSQPSKEWIILRRWK